MKPRPVILKLVTGEEIIAVYIKWKLFTLDIKNPIELISDGDIMNPKCKLVKFSLYGNWDRVTIKKNAIAAVMEPTKEMTDYFAIISAWVSANLNSDLAIDLQRDTTTLSGFVDTTTGKVAVSPESKQEIYRHILETCHFPEGPIH